jgi:hypothetical protein
MQIHQKSFRLEAKRGRRSFRIVEQRCWVSDGRFIAATTSQ